MSVDFNVENNHTDEIIDAVGEKLNLALELIGIDAEKFASALAPVGTPESTGKKGYRGGTLRQSITHQVDEDNHILSVGSNVEYAPYVELGTGPHFQAPPDWEQFTTSKGSGIGHGYVKPRPFLRPALENHLDHYGKIIKDQLS